MNKSEKVQYVINELERLYPKTPVPLTHNDPYTLLIAVLLSAQCTDARVNKIKSIIRPCGLSPKKSKAIHGLSSILINKYNGEVPKNLELLEELPGVGHKTASVVVSQAFGEPAFPVDTHIHRLMYRWGFTNGKNVIQTEKDAKRLFPKPIWNKLHLQIIFYGREYSPARGVKKERDYITMKVGRKSVINNYI